MEKITVVAFTLGLATVLFSIPPYHCPAPLLPNGAGRCADLNVPYLGGASIPSLTSLGLAFCAMEMANKTLRKRSKELKNERRRANGDKA